MKKTIVPILTACALAGSFVSAQNTTWSGGTGNLWSTAANWSAGAPVAGGNLTFNGTTNLTSINDISSLSLGKNGTAISFGTGVGNYVISGNGGASNNLTLNGGITTANTATETSQTISLNLDLIGANRGIVVGQRSTLILSGNISSSTGSGNVAKSGAGTLRLEGNNTFTGGLNVSAGTVVATSIANYGISSAVGNASSGTSIIVGSANNNATLSFDLATANTSNRTFLIGGSGVTAAGGAIINSISTNAANTLTLTGNATGIFNLQQGSVNSTRTLTLGGANTGNNTISGIIQNSSALSNGTINLAKADAGKWILSGNNTYSGTTTLSGGTLQADHVNALGLGGNITFLNLNSTLQYTANTSGTDWASRIKNSGGRINLANNNQHVVLEGVIDSTNTTGFLASGGGSLTLNGSNSFGGNTTITNTTLKINTIADAGANSSLGTGSQIQIGNAGAVGTLDYIGSGNSTNRQIQIGGGPLVTQSAGGFLNSNGTNGGTGLVFTNPVFNAYAGNNTANRTLTLGGNNTDANEIQGSITNNKYDGGNFSTTQGIVSLGKSGDGTWILSGNNTYTGNTTVSNGTLTLSGGNAIADANTLIINGGSVNLAANETVNALFIGATQKPAGNYTNTTPNITGSGTLTVLTGPSATAYETWAGGNFTNAFTGNNTAPEVDYDNDGLKNLLEFVLNGDPTVSDNPSPTPALTVTGTDFVFSFNRRDDSVAETTVLFEYGNDLATWSNATVSAGNSTFTINATLNGTITVNSNNATTDAVSITIPKAASSTGKLFGRLNATQP
jgi:autotransporter-associated beta strand protein